jgi:hypothetical protein
MEISSIAGAAAMAQSSQTHQALSASLIKMNIESQDKVAEMLDKNARQINQTAQSSGYNFSTYA